MTLKEECARFLCNDLCEFCEPWEMCCTPEDLEELENMERKVISDEALTEAYYQAKNDRAQRMMINAIMRNRERIKTRTWQRKADKYKKNAKKKGYDLKQKGQTRKDCRIVPSDALGWDKLNMNIMGNKMHGIKVGYIFDVT